jgi:hypothetical protein
MSKPFFVPSHRSKPHRPVEAVDVAARHLVFKLFEVTNGVQGAWHVLREPLRVCRRPFRLSHAVMAGWSSVAW